MKYKLTLEAIDMIETKWARYDDTYGVAMGIGLVGSHFSEVAGAVPSTRHDDIVVVTILAALIRELPFSPIKELVVKALEAKDAMREGIKK